MRLQSWSCQYPAIKVIQNRGNWNLEAGSWSVEAGNGSLEAGSGSLEAGSWRLWAGNGVQESSIQSQPNRSSWNIMPFAAKTGGPACPIYPLWAQRRSRRVWVRSCCLTSCTPSYCLLFMCLLSVYYVCFSAKVSSASHLF